MHHILVMYAGRGVEYGPATEVSSAPAHPYTWGLLGSVPHFDKREGRLVPIPGSPPSLLAPPPGCPFHPRCRYRDLTGVRAETERPELHDVAPGHRVACHLDDAQRREILETEVAAWL